MHRLANGEPLRQDEVDLLGAIFRREDVLLKASTIARSSL
jgi:hypothetical protein